MQDICPTIWVIRSHNFGKNMLISFSSNSVSDKNAKNIIKQKREAITTSLFKNF